MRAVAKAVAADLRDGAIHRLAATARERFETDGASFDAFAWDIAHLKHRAVSSTNRRIYFTWPGTTMRPLPAYFSEVVKSWLVLERRSAKDMGTRLDALRVLWEAIMSRRGGNPSAFRWDSLCYEDLREAESAMRLRWTENTTHKRTIVLMCFARFLAARSILLFRRRGEMDYAIDWQLRCTWGTRARRRFPVELSDTLWFLFGLGATLSFRPRASRPGADRRFVGLLATIAATLCFA
jgi:hypothetical protein